MMIKVHMTRDEHDDALVLKDTDSAARRIYARSNRGRNGSMRIDRRLHDAFSERFQSEVRRVRLQRADMSYAEASRFVMSEKPELAYAISLDILNYGEGALDVEIEEERA